MESEIAQQEGATAALDRLAQAVSLPPRDKTLTSNSNSRPANHLRWKFQIIYKKVGNLSEAIAWLDSMHVYGQSANTMRPSEGLFQRWAEQVELGEAEFPPKMEQSISDMLDKRPQWMIHDLNRANIAAAKYLAEKKLAGESLKPVEVAYFNNAIGSNAAAITALRNGERKPDQTFQIGKLNINAGPRPAPRIQSQRGAKQGENRKKAAVEAEFREIP